MARPCFAGDAQLESIWREYRETLHSQKLVDSATGEEMVVAVRSTVPAETFFSQHLVVDGRVHSEFFKHLPGIFTGLGIIGTFFGLLRGLSAFQISEDAGVVRGSLTSLLHGVSEAFAANGELFGEERLLSQLATTAGGSAGAISTGVLRAVRGYAAGTKQSDDITVVTVRYTGLA